jgi:hypothetical protein
MISGLTEIFQHTARLGQYAILATLLFVALISFAVALTIVIRLPSDYLCAPRARSMHETSRGIFVTIGIVLKNLFGLVLILLGLILSVPGLPGQGLLTVLAGVLLMDFPRKRSVLHKVLSRPPLLQLINRLRTKFSRPPLVVG